MRPHAIAYEGMQSQLNINTKIKRNKENKENKEIYRGVKRH